MNTLSRIVDIWMNLYLVHMLEISLFIILIWLMDKYFRIEIRWRYLLWILALIKIFFPPVISLPISIQITVPDQVILLPMISNIQSNNHYPETILFSLLAFGLWAIWVFILAAVMLYNNVKVRQHLHDAKLIKDSSKFQINSIIVGLPTFISHNIQSPLLIGFWNPRLYLPEDWQNWSNMQLKSILAHEVAHLHKRDIWILILQNLAIILFGLNPLVWLVYKRLNYLRELRCDEIAIHKSGINPIDYSKFIYTFIERQIKQPGLIFIGKSFFKNDNSLFERINHVLNLEEAKMKTKSYWNISLIFLFAVLILPFSWKCSEQNSLDISEKNDSELNIVQSAPPNLQDKEVVFQPYDTPPQPIGGFKAIQKNLRYPKIARKAGIEGRVVIQVLISEEGNVLDTRVLKSLGESGCDEAAVIAVKSVKWQPALNKDKPVKVWVAIPVVFKLNGSKKTEKYEEPVPYKISIDSSIVFQPFDEAPYPIGGFKVIQMNLRYPEIARKAGIEGQVTVQLLVSETGNILDTRILRSLGASGCDEAAVIALKGVKWQPALYKDNPVKVWVVVPVVFKLK